MNRTGGELIAAILQRQGIGSVFALGGASHLHVLDPLDRQGTKILSHRHEAGAVGAADGYARASGKPGVALIIADQGLANAVGALAVAYQALSPVLVLVAVPPRRMAEAEASIDQDKLALVAPVSKWARTCPARARLADFIHTALKQAVSGRAGPAVLLVPEEQLQQTGEEGEAQIAPYPPIPPAAPEPGAVDAAAALIAKAKRPLIVAGAGVATPAAAHALQEFATRFDLPVMANGRGRGAVPEDFEGSMSWPFGQIAAADADLILLVGARLTQRLGLGLPPRFAPGAQFVQIDMAPEAFHRNRPVDVPILADAALALRALQARLELLAPLAHEAPGWLHARLAPRKARVADLMALREGPLHPLSLAAAIAQVMPEDAVYCGDGADIQNWMYGAIAIRRLRGFMDHYPMGAMGSVTAMAVGAAAALAEACTSPPPVFLVTGDGSIGFHPAELHAAQRAGLRLIVVVGNDGAWGTERHGQLKSAVGRAINTDLGFLPYEKLGEAFGLLGLRADCRASLAAALETAMAAKGPVLINAVIDPEAGAALKSDPLLRMILFSDILEGQAALA